MFAEAENHPVTVTRRDGEPLVLMPQREEDGRSRLRHLAAQIIGVTMDANEPLAARMAKAIPRMPALSPQDRETCAQDLIDAARASFATDQPHRALTELTSWRETATALAAGPAPHDAESPDGTLDHRGAADAEVRVTGTGRAGSLTGNMSAIFDTSCGTPTTERNPMRVAYVLASPRASSYKVAQMILPQLEAGTHGVEVVGMFFFDDNAWVLRTGDPVGERLAAQAAKTGMLLMMCDMCALERGLADGDPRWCAPDGQGRTEPAECEVTDTVGGVRVGCFPNLYAALAGDPPDQVITL